MLFCQVSPAKGVSYYYNTRTGAAQWTKPKILGDDDCPSFDKDHDHIANAEEKKKFSKRLRTHPLTEKFTARLLRPRRCMHWNGMDEDPPPIDPQ